MAIPATTALLKVYDTENADIDIEGNGLSVEVAIRISGEDVKL